MHILASLHVAPALIELAADLLPEVGCLSRIGKWYDTLGVRAHPRGEELHQLWTGFGHVGITQTVTAPGDGFGLSDKGLIVEA